MIYISSLLLSIYPVFFLYSRYIEVIEAENIIFPIFISLVISILTILTVSIIFRKLSKQKKSILSVYFIFLFISYGHASGELYKLLLILKQAGWLSLIEDLTLNIFSQCLVAMLYIGGAIFLKRKLEDSNESKASTISNIITIYILVLMFLPIPQIFIYHIQEKNIIEPHESNAAVIKSESNCLYCESDIYYIIVDGYARNDVLKEFYDFENTKFSNELENIGFKIIKDAHSNYAWTFLSLASSLNMKYIPELNAEIDEKSRDKSPLYPYLRNNLVLNKLKMKGYKYIHINSTYGPTLSNPFADMEFDCNDNFADDDFIKVLMEGTILTVFSSYFTTGLAECHLENFKWLSNSANATKDKKFIFSHMIMPHHPYLFDREGNILRHATLSDQFEFQKNLWRDRDGYLQQLQFLNTQLIWAIREIVNDSEKPPFIIIQADHGPQLINPNGKRDEKYHHGRSSIFMAILTPDKAKEINIKSPVNLFRYLLKEYFYESYELLDDEYYYSGYGLPYIFKKINIE